MLVKHYVGTETAIRPLQQQHLIQFILMNALVLMLVPFPVINTLAIIVILLTLSSLYYAQISQLSVQPFIQQPDIIQVAGVEAPLNWQSSLRVMMLVTGLSWGISLYTILPQPVAVLGALLLLIMAVSFAVDLWCYLSLTLGLSLPLSVWLLQYRVDGFAGLVLILILLYHIACQLRQARSQLEQTAQQNQTLNQSISQTNARLQALNEDLTRLSATDSLTLVANRRHFDERFAAELARAFRERTALSIIMIDVDYFKAYNDTLGHQQGDQCLVTVARLICQSLKRPTDLVARYGGEEFIVLLPNTKQAGAVKLAQAIQTRLAKEALAHPAAPDKVVTLSAGVAQWQPDTHETAEKVRNRRINQPADLIHQADRQLYQAKQQGRNRVCV